MSLTYQEPQQEYLATVSFHIVLRHRNAPQAAQIRWLDDNRPEWITTTPEVAMRCAELQRRNESVRVHRVEWAGRGATVCCECEVAAVREIDEHSSHVSFTNWRVLEFAPLMRPAPAEACYDA